MEIIDNVNKTLKEDLTTEIHNGSKVSIAAACFSIYAFAELKKELKNVDELRFIFTSPTFIKEKAKREKREFYIPRQEREKNLFGSEFEVKLRNEMTQKAIAKECAEWIRKKAVFKGTMESMQLRPIEKAKIMCARRLFNEISTDNVVYHDVDSYQSLLNIMPTIEKKVVQQ